MKRLLSIFSIAAVMAACNNTPPVDIEARLRAYQDSIKLAADTAGLAQFRSWKAQNELADPGQYGQMQYAATATAPAIRTTRTSAPARRSSSRNYGNSSGGSMRSESGNTAKAPVRKKGWSKAAKGAAIGGVAGAAGGAIINKRNRVVGGVVGGVLGGAVGYGIGRSMDKKDGRY